MRYCENCGTEFSYKEKVKSLGRKYSQINCSRCNAQYKKNNRIANASSGFIACIISSTIMDKIKFGIGSYGLRLILAAAIGCIVGFTMILIFNSVIKYERVY